MYAIYYDGATLFDTYLGIEVLDPSLTLEVSVAGTLKFSIPPGHPLYKRLAKMSSVKEVTVLDDGVEIFRGRVLTAGEESNSIQHIEVEGQLAYLNDVRIRPYGTYEDVPDEGEDPAWTIIAPNDRHSYADWLIEQYNLYTDGTKKFSIRTNDLPAQSIVRSATTKPTFRQEIIDKLVDPFDCCIIASYQKGTRYIDFLSDGSRTSTQKIEFGKNLLDFSHTASAVDVITCIIPEGTTSENSETFGIDAYPDGSIIDGVTKQGDRVFLEEGLVLYGTIEDTRSYDAEDVNSLATQVANDILTQPLNIDSVEITAFDLGLVDPTVEKIRLGEWVTISGQPYGFSAQMMCIKIECDLASPGNTKYTFGAEIPSLSTRNKSTVSRIRVQGEELITKTSAISAEAKAAAKKADAAVVASWDEYAVSSSNRDPPLDGWSTVTPVWTDNNYIWRRAVTSYGDGTTVEGVPACMTGNAGASGEDATVVLIDSSNGNAFKNNSVSTTLRAIVFHGATRITTIDALKVEYGSTARIEWSWQRLGEGRFGVISADDTRLSESGMALTISPADVDEKTNFAVDLKTD